MEKKIRIIIPSHKRHDKVLTTSIVTDPILCVSKSQAPLYREHNPDVEIMEHDDDMIGLARKRQWLYEKFNENIMMDDDLTSIRRVYRKEDTKMTPTEVRETLQELYGLAEDLGIFLFTISKNANPLNYNAHVFAPIALTGAVSGAVIGLRGYDQGSKIRFNFALANNDFYISLLNAYYHRRCLIDYRFAFTQKDTLAAHGGMAEFRSSETFERDYYEMKRLFGDSIILKTENKLKTANKAIVKYALSAQIKI
jgi:hypothetical protein